MNDVATPVPRKRGPRPGSSNTPHTGFSLQPSTEGHALVKITLDLPLMQAIELLTAAAKAHETARQGVKPTTQWAPLVKGENPLKD